MGKHAHITFGVALLAAFLFLATDVTAQHDDHSQGQAHQAADAHGSEQDQGHGSEDAHGADAHGEGHEEGHSSIPHLRNWISLVTKAAGGESSPVGSILSRFLDPIFSLIGAMVVILIVSSVYRRRSQEPGRLQVAVEMVVNGLYGLFETVIGDRARRFTPFLGTLFVFILVNNLLGLLPFMHSSTSAFNTTFSLALLTFLYVQYVGIKENGPLGYLFHMAGSPKSGLEWGFVPLMFPLHLLGEFIKPISLSLRLFGNIFGEDTLIATMLLLGVGLMAIMKVGFVGLPLQVPFVFLAMLTSTIQALVFTLLSTIYIALMLPHEHGEDHGGGEVAPGH